jgi:hypothetical protein
MLRITMVKSVVIPEFCSLSKTLSERLTFENPISRDAVCIYPKKSIISAAGKALFKAQIASFIYLTDHSPICEQYKRHICKSR